MNFKQWLIPEENRQHFRKWTSCAVIHPESALLSRTRHTRLGGARGGGDTRELTSSDSGREALGLCFFTTWCRDLKEIVRESYLKLAGWRSIWSISVGIQMWQFRSGMWGLLLLSDHLLLMSPNGDILGKNLLFLLLNAFVVYLDSLWVQN